MTQQSERVLACGIVAFRFALTFAVTPLFALAVTLAPCDVAVGQAASKTPRARAAQTSEQTAPKAATTKAATTKAATTKAATTKAATTKAAANKSSATKTKKPVPREDDDESRGGGADGDEAPSFRLNDNTFFLTVGWLGGLMPVQQPQFNLLAIFGVDYPNRTTRDWGNAALVRVGANLADENGLAFRFTPGHLTIGALSQYTRSSKLAPEFKGGTPSFNGAWSLGLGLTKRFYGPNAAFLIYFSPASPGLLFGEVQLPNGTVESQFGFTVMYEFGLGVAIKMSPTSAWIIDGGVVGYLNFISADSDLATPGFGVPYGTLSTGFEL